VFWALKWFRLQYLKKKERKLSLGPDVDELINHLLFSCACVLIMMGTETLAQQWWLFKSTAHQNGLYTRTKEFCTSLVQVQALLRTFRWCSFTTCSCFHAAGETVEPSGLCRFHALWTHEGLSDALGICKFGAKTIVKEGIHSSRIYSQSQKTLPFLSSECLTRHYTNGMKLLPFHRLKEWSSKS
jgi:hypothetical protein